MKRTENIKEEKNDTEITVIYNIKQLLVSIKQQYLEFSAFKDEMNFIIKTLLENKFILKPSERGELIKNRKLIILEHFVECKSLNELQAQIRKFIYIYFKETYSCADKFYKLNNDFISLFNDFKSQQLFIPEPLTVNSLFQVSPKFLHEYLNLYDQSSFIINNWQSISKYINEELPQLKKLNIKLSSVFNQFKVIYNYIENTGHNDIAILFKQKFNIKKYIELTMKTDVASNPNVIENILKLFPNELQSITEYYIANNQYKQIIKLIKKLNLFSYINEQTLNDLQMYSTNAAFGFLLRQFEYGEMKMLTVYDLIIHDKTLHNQLCSYVFTQLQDNYLYKHIKNKTYSEELELQFFPPDNNCSYLELPPNIKTKLISDDSTENIQLLTQFKNKDYFGIDSEWTHVFNTLGSDAPASTDIIQIASEDTVIVLAVEAFNNNNNLMNIFKDVFSNKTFIGFYFKHDLNEMDKQFKEFFTNEQMCKIIDINDLYKNKMKKQAPDLNKICLELFGKGIDKIERISNWKLRPLRKSQMKYCCLDAFILKFIYNKLI